MHTYTVSVKWTGNLGRGTSDYHAYSRDHEILAGTKAQKIAGSSDPSFRGDGARYNPEELLVAALSTCHMLWMLHLCADDGITVTAYEDDPVGQMVLHADGSGEFVEVTLRPRLTITDASQIADANALHQRAHSLCFIARSVNFDVRCEPRATV